MASADVADEIATASSVGLVSVVMMVWQGGLLGLTDGAVVEGGHAKLGCNGMDVFGLASADVGDGIATASSVGLVSVVMMVWQGGSLGLKDVAVVEGRHAELIWVGMDVS